MRASTTERPKAVDLVPIGAYYGRGKRSGVYGAYLMACYEPERDAFQSVCKVGTGFTDEMLQHLHAKMARRVLGWPLDKPATVFGGLTFGGGPIANYMSHAVVSMVERLRGGDGKTGFLFANGGYATDNHCIVVSREPIAAAQFPQNFDYQAEADAARGPIPELEKDYVGPATVESYTVFHNREGAPSAGVVIARTPEGKRTLCHIDVPDAAMLAFFMDGTVEPVGTAGAVATVDERRVWQR